jgi:predicted HicB family RNase H-like nuclease
MKRITIEVDDKVHARLVEKAKADDRSLVKYIGRVLARDASVEVKGHAA